MASHTKLFHKIMNDYEDNRKNVEYMLTMHKAGNDFLKEPTTRQKIKEYFQKRQDRMINMFGENRDIYDDVMEFDSRNGATKKKYYFLIKDGKNLVHEHKLKIKEISEKITFTNKSTSVDIPMNRSAIIQESELLPLIGNNLKRNSSVCFSKSIKDKICKKANENIRLKKPPLKLDEKYQKRLLSILERTEMQSQLINISRKIPANSIKMKCDLIKQNTFEISKDAKKKFKKRTEQGKIISRHISHLIMTEEQKILELSEKKKKI